MLSAAVVSERLKYAEMKNIQDIRRVPHVSLLTKDAQFEDGRGSTGGKHTVVSTSIIVPGTHALSWTGSGPLGAGRCSV